MAFELGFKPLIKYKDTRAAIDAQVPFPAGYYNQLMFSSDINEIRSVLNDGTLSHDLLTGYNGIFSAENDNGNWLANNINITGKTTVKVNNAAKFVIDDNSGNIGINMTATQAGAREQFSVNGKLWLEDNGTQSTYVGARAGLNATGGFNTIMGYAAGDAITTSSQNVLMGQNSGSALTTNGFNVGIGQGALGLATSASNTAIGHGALGKDTTGFNVALGRNAGANNTGGQIIAIGYNSLALNTTASNIAVGRFSMENLTLGSNNLGFGNSTLRNVINGQSNLALGNNSLTLLRDGNSNMAIGLDTFDSLLDGDGNTGLGAAVGQGLVNGNDNLLLGKGSGSLIVNHSNNVIVGANAGNSFVTENSIIIGTGVNADGSNQVRIGGGFHTQAWFGGGIFGTIPGYRFNIDQPLSIAEDGYVLTYNNTSKEFEAAAATGGGTITADNGLTKTGDNIQLGGNLIENTTLTGNGFDLAYNTTGGNNTVFIDDSSGNVGFGRVNPLAKIHVQSVDSLMILRQNTNTPNANTYSLYIDNKAQTGNQDTSGPLYVDLLNGPAMFVDGNGITNLFAQGAVSEQHTFLQYKDLNEDVFYEASSGLNGDEIKSHAHEIQYAADGFGNGYDTVNATPYVRRNAFEIHNALTVAQYLHIEFDIELNSTFIELFCDLKGKMAGLDNTDFDVMISAKPFTRMNDTNVIKTAGNSDILNHLYTWYIKDTAGVKSPVLRISNTYGDVFKALVYGDIYKGSDVKSATEAVPKVKQIIISNNATE